jgi:thiamine transport system permease protein
MGRSRWDVVPLVFLLFSLFLPLSSLFMIFPPTGGVSRYTKLLIYNFEQSSLSALISLIGGLIISWFLANRKINPFLESVVHSISKVSFVFPGVSMAIGFFFMLGKNGIVGTIGRFFGKEIDLLYTFPAVVMGHAFYNIPVVVYIVGTMWENLDRSVVESAELDGAGELAIFRKIVFPLLFPSVISSYLMAFLYSFTSFAVVMTIGGFRYRTLEVEIYSQISRLNFHRASSITLLQMVIVSGLAFASSFSKSSDFPYGFPKRKSPKSADYILFSIPFFLIIIPVISSVLLGFFKSNVRFGTFMQLYP